MKKHSAACGVTAAMKEGGKWAAAFSKERMRARGQVRKGVDGEIGARAWMLAPEDERGAARGLAEIAEEGLRGRMVGEGSVGIVTRRLEGEGWVDVAAVVDDPVSVGVPDFVGGEDAGRHGGWLW
jgi:hypothetical protein